MAVVFSSRQIKRTRSLLARFNAVLHAARFYPAQHPIERALVQDLMEVIHEYHAEGADLPLTFFEGELLLGENLLPDDSIMFEQLIRDMSSTGVGSITFGRGLTVDELHRAMRVIGVDSEKAASTEGGLPRMLVDADVEHVSVGAVAAVGKTATIASGVEPEVARRSYSTALDLMREMDRAVHTAQPVSAARIQGVVQGLIDSIVGNRHAILELSGLKSYDEYTYFHSVNVTILSLTLGSSITQDQRFLSALGCGALMHDLGKVSIDVDVLNKPGTLSPDEWSTIREHPVQGAEVAARVPGLDRASLVVILEHHMRYDTTGYPVVKGSRTRPHLASRILGIADAYDAMTSNRTYSPARLQSEAMEVLVENMGTAFDPVLVRLFVNTLGAYPPRSVVRLSDGDIAVVLSANSDDITRPRVRAIADANGVLHEPLDIDLLSDAEAREIVGCLDPAGLDIDIEDYLSDLHESAGAPGGAEETPDPVSQPGASR